MNETTLNWLQSRESDNKNIEDLILLADYLFVKYNALKELLRKVWGAAVEIRNFWVCLNFSTTIEDGKDYGFRLDKAGKV